jgi:hypothetical protein
VHLKALANGTEYSNGTNGESGIAFEGGSQVWSGQLYFPQEVVSEITSQGIYASNASRGALMLNSEDRWHNRALLDGYDGIMEVEELEGGAMAAWISLGIDPEHGGMNTTHGAQDPARPSPSPEQPGATAAASKWWVQSGVVAVAVLGGLGGVVLL